MTSRQWTLLAVATALLFAVVGWGVSSNWKDSPSGLFPPTSSSVSEGLPASGLIEARGDKTTNLASSDSSIPRVIARPGSSVVVDMDGKPIAGAQARWFALSDSWDADATWPLRDWSVFLQGATSGESDVQGEIFLAPPANAAVLGSRVSVSRSGYATFVIEFDRGVEPVLPMRIELAQRAPIEVSVVDARSVPVVGAIVRSVREVAPIGKSPLPTAETRSARYLIVEETTDVSGVASIATLDGAQLVWATDEASVSRVARIEGPGEVELRLAPALSIRGRVVTAEPGVQLTPARVAVFAMVGSGGERVAEVDVRADGSFGSIEVPLDRDVEYSLQAQGPEFKVSTVTLQQQAAGGDVFVEIPVLAGVRVPVRIIDKASEPVEGAYVWMNWQAGERWEKARAVTDSSGMADVGRVPVADVSVGVKASGKTAYQRVHPIPSEVSPYLEIQLEDAGTIRGRVVHAGKPVRDFVVHWWTGDARESRSDGFRGRADGSFALESVPFGTVKLVACGTHLPRSPEVAVLVQPDGEPQTVVLELSDPITGRGVIVDAVTGEPLSGVTVQAWTSTSLASLATFGLAVQTGAEGKFEFERFAPGLGLIEISSTGFATATHQRETNSGRVTDFGNLGLERVSTLDVELVGDVDPSRYSAVLTGPTVHPGRTFGADRILKFEGLTSGSWSLAVYGPNDAVFVETIVVAPASKGRFRFPVPAGRLIRVELIDERKEPRVPLATLRVAPANALARRIGVEGIATIKEGEFIEFPTPDFESAFLSVVDADLTVVGITKIESLSSAPEPIRMRITNARERVLIVDRKHAPIPGATLILLQKGGGWSGSGVADQQGVVAHSTPPVDVAAGAVYVVGGGVGLVGDVLLNGTPQEITFDPSASLHVQVVDGSVPIDGCRIDLTPAGWPSMALATGTSTSGGRVEFARLTAAEYTASSSSVSIWPVSRNVRSTAGGQIVPFEVRRRGSVSLKVTRAGANIPWSELRIRSVEFDADVSAWIESGLVQINPADEGSGPDSRARIEGLPRGQYQWSGLATDGQARTGTFEVPPGKRADVVIVID